MCDKDAAAMRAYRAELLEFERAGIDMPGRLRARIKELEAENARLRADGARRPRRGKVIEFSRKGRGA